MTVEIFVFSTTATGTIHEGKKPVVPNTPEGYAPHTCPHNAFCAFHTQRTAPASTAAWLQCVNGHRKPREFNASSNVRKGASCRTGQDRDSLAQHSTVLHRRDGRARLLFPYAPGLGALGRTQHTSPPVLYTPKYGESVGGTGGGGVPWTSQVKNKGGRGNEHRSLGLLVEPSTTHVMEVC